MAYKKSYKKSYKPFKKAFKKRNYKRRGKLNMMVNKAKIGGFPDTYFTPLTYKNASFAMGDTNPSFAYSFTATDPTKNNSIAPQGWSILKQVYDTFLVHAIKVKVTFYNTSTTIPCKVFITMIDQDDNNVPTSGTGTTAAAGNLLSTTAYCKSAHLSIAGGGKDNVTITFMMKISKFAGKKKLTPADERNLGNTGSGNSATAFTQPIYLPKIWYGVVSATGANLAVNQVYAEENTTWYTQFLERLGPMD